MGQVASLAQKASINPSNFDSPIKDQISSDESVFNGNSTENASIESKKATLTSNNYLGDIRWEKAERIKQGIKELLIPDVKGTSISEVYANTPVKRSIPPNASLSVVGFSSMDKEPTDDEVHELVDDAIKQVLGPRGLSEIIKPGDKVVIKVNIVGPSTGLPGEKGRGIISDPRIVRYVAEEVRKVIGFNGTADLKVIDAAFRADKNPSDKNNSHSFYYARLERTGNDTVDLGDICYDYDADGILDGSSAAKIVNLDSV